MRFSVWPSPQRPWSEILETARHAEATGWDGVWFADHFMPAGSDVDQPLLECWTALTGLAALVPRIRVGALVSANTCRHPAVLANMAVTLDHVSGGGRVVLGLGAGWQENEHRAYGIDLPPPGERLARLEEACQVVKGLLGPGHTTLHGTHYTLRDAPCEPKPVTGGMPLLIGGGGERVTMRIAARYADEWNVWGDPETMTHKGDVLERHCEDLGRDPAEIRRSCQAMLFLSEDDVWLADKREQTRGQVAIVGTPEKVAEVVGAYRDAGVDELVVPDWNFGPMQRRKATMDLFAERVAPDFR